jgi:hypothetical protein
MPAWKDQRQDERDDSDGQRDAAADKSLQARHLEAAQTETAEPRELVEISRNTRAYLCISGRGAQIAGVSLPKISHDRKQFCSDEARLRLGN